ncbi:hypothetical protein [Spiroplasma taiwanense]|uniref:Transmembrane protein n=1 Tax=Spiroplasma taiwanense CT-1 TaxID=1276220 RepID=S5LX43_9MOLU|nr:hypothetical protein [Spiroplasma taiwanense]AGR41196.1 hypothetical protein STAIW_v1c05740 [Spiroplasma taiwanense CT-1]
MKVIGKSKRIIKDSKGIILLYATIGILVALFLLSPLLDHYVETVWESRMLIYAKLLLGFFITALILRKLFFEMVSFIENYEIKQSIVKDYNWIIKRENLSIFIRSILILTPFIALSFYNIIAVTNENLEVNQIQTFDIFEKVMVNFKEDSFKIVLNKLFILIFSGFVSIIFGSIVFVYYKISMKMFYEDIDQQLKIISKKSKNEENRKQMFGETKEIFIREKAQSQKAFLFERNGKILNFIKSLESDKWKEIKKSTCPPLYRFNSLNLFS